MTFAKSLKRWIGVAGFVLGILSFGFLLSDHYNMWDGVRGIDALNEMSTHMDSSYASIKRQYRSSDAAWAPFFRLVRHYAPAKIPANKTPVAIARMEAVQSGQIKGPFNTTLAEWTAPTTPLIVTFKEPNTQFSTDDYVIVGTIGDLKSWIAADKADFNFLIYGILFGVLSLVVSALAASQE